MACPQHWASRPLGSSIDLGRVAGREYPANRRTLVL